MVTYKITVNNNSYDITPRNSGQGKKFVRDTKSFYREDFVGEIVLTGDDYHRIKSFETTNPQITLTVNKNSVVEFVGYFFAWDCTFDEDNCSVTCKIKPLDKYNSMMKNFDKKYNIISLLRNDNKVTARFLGTSTYEFETIKELDRNFLPGNFRAEVGTNLLIRSNVIIPGQYIKGLSLSNQFANKYRIFKQRIEWTVQPTFSVDGTEMVSDNTATGNVITEAIREIKYVVANNDGTHTVPSAEYDLVDTLNFIGATVFKYARYVNFQTNVQEHVWRRPNEVENTFNPSSQNSASSTYFIQVRKSFINLENNEVDYTNIFGSFYGVINHLYKLVTGSTLTLAVKSDLLFPFNNINPLNNEANEYSLNINQGGQFYQRGLLIAQKSDFKNPTATEKATKGELSLKDCLDYITEFFNCGWFINDAGQLQIEHVSFFEKGLSYTSLPTSGATDIRAEVGVKRQNKYSFDLSRMYNYLQLRYSEAAGLDFLGLEINCVPTNNNQTVNKKSYTESNFTADIEHVKASPNSISNDGFVIVVAEKDFTMPIDEYYVAQTTSPLTGLFTLNGLLSVATLQDRFFKIGMPFNTVQINGANITITELLKHKQQEDLQFTECTSITPFKIYRTGLGFGIVKEVEQNFTTGKVMLSLYF